MTDRELKKLNRTELLEMLLALSKENDSLRQENDELHAKLEEKRIRMEQTGSIAEAALALSGVFEAAQAAADLYLNSVREQEADSAFARPRDEASQSMLDDTQKRCDDMLANAQQQVDAMWQRFYQMDPEEEARHDRQG